MPPAARRAIAALGREIGPASLQGVQALYDEEQRRLSVAPVLADAPYGEHERQRLDLYAPAGASGAPLFVWVHGGGFLRGDKGDLERWPNAHAGRWAAANGMVGVVVNYRLAPEHRWPSGAEDLAAVVAWLEAHAAAHGGDPALIVLAGTSAGAAHVASYLQREAGREQIAGAVLLSGLYGVAPFSDVRDRSYYGEDDAAHGGMASLSALAQTRVPLFAACSEYDPPRFQAEYAGLIEARSRAGQPLPVGGVIAGHNHFSLAYHLGTADRRLSDALLDFVAGLPKSLDSTQ
ncbi:alpha/beta hydrolase [Sphingomonas ginkgonis]|uniref:Alpha/beta hydrolase n=2 Tax=Sphingomonas ginkgonis TaxID=2315330 RepID=A0A429VE74_9SPHN|nr:alpha/beta hydrolase [Sphingomonas ginkgonis]